MTPIARTAFRVRNASGFLFVVFGAACWGTDALFRRGLTLDLPAPTIVFAEHLILVVLTLPLLRGSAAMVRSLPTRDRAALVVIGVGASAVATWFFTLAMQQGDPTTPLLLQKLQPLFAIVAAHVLLGERLRWRFAPFAIAALVFAWLITFADPTHLSADMGVAAAYALTAAALWAMGTVLGRRLSTVIAPLRLAALRFLIGLPASALVALVDGGPSSLRIPVADAPALIGLAFVPGLLGMVFYYRGLGGTAASAATLGELAFPLVAVSVNWLAFGTALAPSQWVGLTGLVLTLATMSYVQSHGGTSAMGVVQPASRPVAWRSRPSGAASRA